MTQGNGKLQITGSALVVGSPGISTRGLPRETGSFKLVWTMKTNRKGICRVFWSGMETRPYRPERCKSVDIISENGSHEYRVEFDSDEELYGLRLDLGTGSDSVEIESMKLLDGNENVKQAWDFADAQ